MLLYQGNPLLRAALLVAATWWLGAIALDWLRTPGWLQWVATPGVAAALASYTARAFGAWVAGLALGVAAVVAGHLALRVRRRLLLAPGEVRGLRSSLGPVPLARMPVAPHVRQAEPSSVEDCAAECIAADVADGAKPDVAAAAPNDFAQRSRAALDAIRGRRRGSRKGADPDAAAASAGRVDAAQSSKPWSSGPGPADTGASTFSKSFSDGSWR